jgi:Arc/MetJ-type ribon-helix-helix transcriptional regulator
MPDLEKLTINLGPVDLGQIELLVEQGFYANRAEFIRSAIQSQLQRHSDTVKAVAQRHAYVLGALHYDSKVLERHREKGVMLDLHVIGLLSLASDVTPALAAETIASVRVHGLFRAPDAVKAALADRME